MDLLIAFTDFGPTSVVGPKLRSVFPDRGWTRLYLYHADPPSELCGRLKSVAPLDVLPQGELMIPCLRVLLHGEDLLCGEGRVTGTGDSDGADLGALLRRLIPAAGGITLHSVRLIYHFGNQLEISTHEQSEVQLRDAIDSISRQELEHLGLPQLWSPLKPAQRVEMAHAYPDLAAPYGLGV